MFKVSGISGKAEIEEDEEIEETTVVESSRKALVEVLGVERRDRILAALYLARQDAVNVVRQSSAHIWKALVHNTPRTGEGTWFTQAYHPIGLMYAGSARDFARTRISDHPASHQRRGRPAGGE